MDLSLESLVRRAGLRRWIGEAHALRAAASARGQMPRNDVKGVIANAVKLIDNGRPHDAAHLLFAGLILDEFAVLSAIQQAGLFRLSRRRFLGGSTGVTARLLRERASDFKQEAREYLESVGHLHRVAKGARAEYRALQDWLSQEREHGFKGALATLDWLFLVREYSRVGAQFPWGFQEGPQTDLETLAEGLSTILAVYNEVFGPLRGNTNINAKAAANGQYLRWLVCGVKLAKFRDWELQVDRLQYRVALVESPANFRIQPPTPEFGRAVDLGYAHSGLQRAFRPAAAVNPKSHTFIDLGRKLAQGDPANALVKKIDEPVPRLRLEFPESLVEALKDIRDLTQEEQAALATASHDLLTSADELLAFEIADRVSLRDFFMLARQLHLLRSILAEALFRESDRDLELVLQSLVPAFLRDDLQRLFMLATGQEPASAVLGLLLTDLRGHIDLLYRPLLPAGKTVLMPLNIFTSSNLLRNPLVISGRRLYEDGEGDPVSKGLRTMLAGLGLPVQAEVTFSWNGQSGECDILAVIDDVVLVLECKNSILPTSSHELLTSVDHIRTAARQLGRFSRLFSDSGFQETLSRRTGLALPSHARLVTGIIMANRMLIGWRLDGHPVRGMLELQQFMTEGTVTMGEETRSFWLGSKLLGEDVRRFFQEDITYEPQWKSMDRLSLRHDFPGCTVRTDPFALNGLKLARELGFQKTEQALTEMLQEHKQS